jgi:hypothetical protein
MTVDLGDVTTMAQVLTRTPNGTAVAKLAERLGLVTAGGVRSAVARKAFIADVSSLVPTQLSDEQSYWTGEYGRIMEIIGLLQGQEKVLSLQSKSARAKARGRVRAKALLEEKKPSATQVADEAEDDSIVIDVDQQSETVIVLLSSAMAAKEATLTYLSSLSREISFRCSQYDNHIL